MKPKNTPLFLLIMLPVFYMTPVDQAADPEYPCRYFYERLEKLPHEEIEYQEGIIEFSLDRNEYEGCRMNFVTNESTLSEDDPLPSMWGISEESDLYTKGWRMNINYQGDGPGTSVYGIEKNETLCLISHSQPAYLESPGVIVQVETITILVECRME
ncbi:MAG: hypothetical protein WD449_02800 [Candidatus Babeliales bacterium]